MLQMFEQTFKNIDDIVSLDTVLITEMELVSFNPFIERKKED
jgi:hypothetical protein